MGRISILSMVKRMDVYRTVPNDLTTTSVAGAVLSLACMMAISLLVFSEVNSFLAVKSQSFMVVDTPRGLQRLQVNLNVTVPHVPCHVLTLDCVDAMGGGAEDSGIKSITKLPLSRKYSEGCLISGYFHVPKVPGNFRLFASGKNIKPEEVDMQHTVHSLSFTDASRTVVHYPPGTRRPIEESLMPGLLSPLDDTVRESSQVKLPTIYEYYIQIVPTTFEHENGKEKHYYQFTYNFND